jgi:hypothetical protein
LFGVQVFSLCCDFFDFTTVQVLRQPKSRNRVVLPELSGLVYTVSTTLLETLPLPHPTVVIAFHRLDSITVHRNYFGSSDTKRVGKHPIMNEAGGIDGKTRAIQNPDRLLWLNMHCIVIKFMPDSIQSLKVFRRCSQILPYTAANPSGHKLAPDSV